jgi:hypothetical protein
MMVAMRTQDPNQDLQDGVDLDAKPRLEPMRAPSTPYPRLCEAGPCQNYHRMEFQADAESPRTVRTSADLSPRTRGVQPVPDGTAYLPPPTFYVQVNHYCYPSPGIEMPLGALPVIRCNRWDPIPPLAAHAHGLRPETTAAAPIKDRREIFLESTHGVLYREQVAAWERQQAQETSEAEEAELLIAQSLGKETP